MLELKSNEPISNVIIKIKPWENCAIKINEGISNIIVENCIIERLTWRKWVASIFHF